MLQEFFAIRTVVGRKLEYFYYWDMPSSGVCSMLYLNDWRRTIDEAMPAFRVQEFFYGLYFPLTSLADLLWYILVDCFQLIYCSLSTLYTLPADNRLQNVFPFLSSLVFPHSCLFPKLALHKNWFLRRQIAVNIDFYLLPGAVDTGWPNPKTGWKGSVGGDGRRTENRQPGEMQHSYSQKDWLSIASSTH